MLLQIPMYTYPVAQPGMAPAGQPMVVQVRWLTHILVRYTFDIGAAPGTCSWSLLWVISRHGGADWSASWHVRCLQGVPVMGYPVIPPGQPGMAPVGAAPPYPPVPTLVATTGVAPSAPPAAAPTSLWPQQQDGGAGPSQYSDVPPNKFA